MLLQAAVWDSHHLPSSPWTPPAVICGKRYLQVSVERLTDETAHVRHMQEAHCDLVHVCTYIHTRPWRSLTAHAWFFPVNISLPARSPLEYLWADHQEPTLICLWCHSFTQAIPWWTETDTRVWFQLGSGIIWISSVLVLILVLIHSWFLIHDDYHKKKRKPAFKIHFANQELRGKLRGVNQEGLTKD